MTSQPVAPGARTGAYRLVRDPLATPRPPVLDAYQQAVVDHRGGPLLVLAGPGTGKTTTLVEAVTRRIAEGVPADEVLVLTFSRKAAVELRDRMTARVGGLGGVPQATTFHSFCYALVRAQQDQETRLASGPEQDVMVRELLAGNAEDARDGRGVRWPDELRACLTTRGFADEVRAVLARTRELGLGEDELKRFAERVGRPDWHAAAAFLADYLDVLDLRGVLDYSELVHRAVLLAERPEVGERLRRRYRVVFVDEYQDTDPAQVRLLRALAGDGRELIAVGDPDQSIYAFRGADINGILGFPQDFPRADGRPAPIRVLRVSRRSGATLLAASRTVALRMPMARLPAEALTQHRQLIAEQREGGSEATPSGVVAGRRVGRVEVYTYPTPGSETDNIADLLRRAHLEEGVPWGEMAVLVRAGARSIPGFRRALGSAGVPLEIDGDDLPLHAEPAVEPLLTALRVCADGAVHDRRMAAVGSAPGEDPLTAELARQLLTGPLGALDGADLRRLGRALREEERAALRALPPEHQRAVRPADQLVREALAEPERLVTLDGVHARRAHHLGQLLRKVRESLAGDASAEDALWALWDGSERWRQRLEAAALRPGTAGRNADRDLDAICALFETAARSAERMHGPRDALNFLAELEQQDIAADTLSGRTVRPDAVRLLTAHRSKGLEWRLVVVAGVQEGLWPDLRRRGSLLEADRIGRDGLAEPLSPGALLGEERRLFYTAVTRARERLIVTAVKAPADDGDQPSRFLRELYRELPDGTRVPDVRVEDVSHRPRRPLAVAALVAELRATTVDPAASPELREAAAERLTRLAALTDDDGVPLVPAAHPQRWWGMAEATGNAVPVREPEQPLRLSGSALEQVGSCALQWFLGREVRAEGASSAAQGFGNVVHVLADEVGSGRTPAELGVLMERLDTVWDALAFDAPWKSEQEKGEARAALERFLRWHADERGRVVAATEHPFEVELEAGGHTVRIRGSMDRVEREEPGGAAFVVDFKTGKRVVSGPDLRTHPQLGVYQLAVRAGAVDGLEAFAGEQPQPGGAELVQLRQAAGKDQEDRPKVQGQPSIADDSGWIEGLLVEAADRIVNERFVPTVGPGCDHCSFRRSCTGHPEGRQVVE
ncbi:ATP-dependent DNA helicase [Streptacidiphilus sp. P02-A3a]|uniref:ATP-dependent helicase n=1 Tax=Streptacidiphilus sp. P02-A3a TaxID=2704468 RepID=UPI0015FCB0C5|nr:ATP-dependent DNA helicase [Streptacidiphilus sp. P02-A3a]QMU67756.1 ATP-dependent helicase [Streptacidiphilus sp. P02-A3a]